MDQKGKMSIIGIFIVFLILYGAFAAVKIVSAHITEDQIEKKIKDRIGRERGYNFTEEQGREIIFEILSKSKNVVFNQEEEGAIDLIIDREKGLIIYYYEYELVTDLIFFEKRKKISHETDMKNFR